ncbi:MAG: hypothetical protein U9N81_02545 [Bacillota bacterium]|nr:hypothetical protein [Bacillota bacterium]
MKNRHKTMFPRPMLKTLAEDIKRLVHSTEGYLQILDIMEEIPYDVRQMVIEGLSSFYWPEMVIFFHLLKEEYGREIDEVAKRALTKYRLAGMNVECPDFFNGQFYKAYASCTRHTGRMSVDVAWETGDQGLQIESFFLSFRSDGLHSMIVVDNMPADQFELDRENLMDMVELTYEETCFVLQDAYYLNIRCMNRPALGKFLYKKYMNEEYRKPPEEVKTLWRNLSNRLTPRQLVNSFFYAAKYQDLNYIFSVFSSNQSLENILLYQLNKMLKHGHPLLEAKVEDVKGSQEEAEVHAYSIRLNGRRVWRDDFVLGMTKEEGNEWVIASMDMTDTRMLEEDSAWNPFHMQVTCRIYDIEDMDGLFEALDSVDDIREVEELPYGLHMRITCMDDDFTHGFSFMTGVIADMVINGDEFVIISKDLDAIQQLHSLFNDGESFLCPTGEYQVSLTAALNYISGQYVHFDDILLEEDEELVFEDGMRCITARYVVKDRERVLAKLDRQAHLNIQLPGGFQVYYQIETDNESKRFMAEYILAPNWITASAFGEQDIAEIRRSFEEDMYEALEFDGLEIREEGIFEILTYDVKKQYPDLESNLKELYLNKWAHSYLPSLQGMSPSEACQTEEGTRLLWEMYKRIRHKEKTGYSRGQGKQIGLKDYIRRLETGN